MMSIKVNKLDDVIKIQLKRAKKMIFDIYFRIGDGIWSLEYAFTSCNMQQTIENNIVRK